MARIAVDIDGVIAGYDFWPLTQMFIGSGVDNESISQYDLSAHLGVPTEVFTKMFRYALQHQELQPLIVGAVETIQALYDQGHIIYICTNRLRFCSEAELERQLQVWEIPYQAIFDNGLPMLMDYFIDDNITRLVNQTRKVEWLLLFDQPWNRNTLNLWNLFHRVKSWAEVKKFIEEKEATR